MWFDKFALNVRMWGIYHGMTDGIKMILPVPINRFNLVN